jgi:hypothetical protein
MNESNAQFRSVLRGYDTAQVDQRVRELTQTAEAAQREAGGLSIQVSKLEATQRQLRSDVEGQVARTHALEEARNKAAAPTYADLGERIGSMLTLADEEGAELRIRAQADAETHVALANESARVTREDADGYAMEAHSSADAEVARLLEDARRRADSVLDDADRQATTRCEEAEALYERARAKSAAAVADFETTLAARRESSAQEFAEQVATAEQQLAAVQQRAEQIRTDSIQAQQESTSRSANQLEQARVQAETLVSEAKTKAERIRDDSERMLVAATQRRDSINAQLTNVRQMLATLTGGAMASPSEQAGPEQAGPVTEQSDPDAADGKAVVIDLTELENAAQAEHGPSAEGHRQEGVKEADDNRKTPRRAAGVKS